MGKKRTLNEQRKLYELWQQSGITKSEFCRQNHIGTQSMWKWHKEFGKEVARDHNCAVKIEPTENIKFYQIDKAVSANRQDNFLEIVMPNGASCKAYLSEDGISVFLRELLK